MTNPACAWLTMEQFHGKRNIGSTRLRVHNLIKYWPEAELYRYGVNPAALVFQKVYISQDYRFPETFKGIKILDICDPDWLEGMPIKETVDAMDGVTVPTESLASFIRQLTDKPVKVIPDRHDLEGITPPLSHNGKVKNAVWFGYKHNADVLRFVVPVLEKRGIALTVISDDNPYVNGWAKNKETFSYYFKSFDASTLMNELRQFDIAVLPQGTRPKDIFKSNNKTIIAQLAGLPVVTDLDSLDAMLTPEARDKEAKICYDKAIKEYDVKLSVQDMKDFINELKNV